MQDSLDLDLALLDWPIAFAGALFGADSRLYLPYIIAFVITAYAVYRMSGQGAYGGFWRYLVPRDVYLRRSHLTDIQLFVAGRLLAVVGVFNASVLVTACAAGAMWALSQVFERQPVVSQGTLAGFLMVTLLVTIVADLCVYWVHRLHHEHPVLWPFHKVHHSAEVLTPVTVYRKHPVYDIISASVKAVPIGTLQGVILFAFLGKIELVTIAGANIAYVAFNFLGSNLRHSHVWLDFGPVLDHIFISPAQHQIHHSRAPRHFNRNYGEILAVWDWAFGTLYVPRGREQIEFGLADERGTVLAQPHPTFTRAMIEPFREAGATLTRARQVAQS